MYSLLLTLGYSERNSQAVSHLLHIRDVLGSVFARIHAILRFCMIFLSIPMRMPGLYQRKYTTSPSKFFIF